MDLKTFRSHLHCYRWLRVSCLEYLTTMPSAVVVTQLVCSQFQLNVILDVHDAVTFRHHGTSGLSIFRTVPVGWRMPHTEQFTIVPDESTAQSRCVKLQDGLFYLHSSRNGVYSLLQCGINTLFFVLHINALCDISSRFSIFLHCIYFSLPITPFVSVSRLFVSLFFVSKSSFFLLQLYVPFLFLMPRTASTSIFVVHRDV